MINSDSSGAVIIPPIIGAAMRLITSDPAPVPHKIGNRPAIITATVIAFGRTRRTAPWYSASSSLSTLKVCGFFSDGSASMAWRRYISITTPNSAATPARAIKPVPVATDKWNPIQ